MYVPAGLGNHTLQGCVHEGEEENTAEEESHQDEDPVHLVQQRVLHLQLGKEEGEHRPLSVGLPPVWVHNMRAQPSPG